MRTDRTCHRLGWLLVLLPGFAALAATDAPAPAAMSCEVAIPSECQPQAGDGFGQVRQQRPVKGLPAASEAECMERAHEAATACIGKQRGKEDVTARFRNGPVETILQVTASAEPASRTEDLRMPIVYGKNFETEFAQYGYSPRFAPGVVNLSNDGRIHIRHRNYLQSQTRDGKWVFTDLAAAASEAIRRLPDVASFEWVWDARAAYSDLRIYFDARGRAYTLVQGGRTRIKEGKSLSHRPYLLVSKDDMGSWAAVAMPAPDERPTWRARIEHNDGNNDRSGPPPVLLYDRTEDVNKRSTRLFLVVPQWKGDDLTFLPAVLVSEKSLLQENHSGAANSVVSTADKIYIVYPGAQSVPDKLGTPAYMAVFNKTNAALEGETLIGFGGSTAGVDNHNTPGACIGTKQTIHALLPGHQEALRFRTGKLDGASVIWAPDEAIGQAPASSGGYTYGSLNCDRAGNVYVTSRWAGDSYRFQLVLLHRKADGLWTTWAGKSHKLLVDPGRPFYGAWRHKLTLDAEGTLFLSYSYYANQLTKDELSKLKWRFPFQNWAEVKELQPRMCVKGEDPRCWLHPMPEVTAVVLKSRGPDSQWDFVQ